LIGACFGGVALIYAKPIQRHLQRYNAIFRKPWMKLPVYGSVFMFFGYFGVQFPAKILPKLASNPTGVSHSTVLSHHDMVAKFRLFDNVESSDQRDGMASYLSVYSTEPITKNEMIDNIALNALK
jgi:hypothetical protein